MYRHLTTEIQSRQVKIDRFTRNKQIQNYNLKKKQATQTVSLRDRVRIKISVLILSMHNAEAALNSLRNKVPLGDFLGLLRTLRSSLVAWGQGEDASFSSSFFFNFLQFCSFLLFYGDNFHSHIQGVHVQYIHCAVLMAINICQSCFTYFSRRFSQNLTKKILSNPPQFFLHIIVWRVHLMGSLLSES